MQPIDSASLKYYNANPSNRNVGDCVKRSLSLAFDADYNSIGKELNGVMHKMHLDKWNVPMVFDVVIKDHSGATNVKLDAEWRKGTLENFIDNYTSVSTGPANEGTWLLLVGDIDSRSNHLVCIIDGVAYDSWDSLSRHPISYYKINNIKRVFSDLTDYIGELNDLAYEMFTDLCEKYMQKYQLGYCEFLPYSVRNPDNISIKLKADIKVPYEDGYTVKYPIEEIIKFTLSTTYDQAVKKVKESIKVKTYDRFYALNQTIEKRKEEADMRVRTGEDSKLSLWTSQEQQCYNSLPGWARALVRSLYVSRGNSYLVGDYELYMNPHPDDPNRSTFKIAGDDIKEVKYQLDKYINDNWARPWEDYDPY